MRITSFSPNAVGSVEMRSSMSSPSALRVLMRPSCGRRFSTTSMRAEDLDAAGHRRQHRGRDLVDLVQHAVDAEAHDALLAPRLDVDVARALLEGVLPQPVDHAHDVRVVGVELLVGLAELDQLLEVGQPRGPACFCPAPLIDLARL